MADGHLVGYIGISTLDQNTTRRLDRIFTDEASGKDRQRAVLEEMVAYVWPGDTIVIHSVDRLARNLDDLREMVQILTNRGVRINFVKEVICFTGDDSAISNLLFSVMGASVTVGVVDALGGSWINSPTVPLRYFHYNTDSFLLTFCLSV